MMNIYFAPMEGITGFVFRNAFNSAFPYIDKYFSPFIATNHNKTFTLKEFNDINAENNRNIRLVPQILSNNYADSIFLIDALFNQGYEEININLGCPSKTVVSKNRGSGFLAYPEDLDKYLYYVYEFAVKKDIKVSVKTRIGKTDEKEWTTLIDIYNKYPIEELIIHPRLQTDYYQNSPRMNCFDMAVKDYKRKLCYNGDVFKISDYIRIRENYTDISAVMCGRGFLFRPGLLLDIKNFETGSKHIVTKDDIFYYHEEIYKGYMELISGERNLLYKMKEVWSYLIHNFKDSEKYLKAIRKANRKIEYENAVRAVFRDLSMVD